ncbi:MAG: tRNA lysidine(34) synthetase TilS [candidate division Zixibacteria bacterium]|nr:tRNA lysidine(34) synthetase TilS [candidate division Zixibacteria bacterium]
MDMPIVTLVERYFSRYGRPRRGAHVLVALSGGPDSVALLAILAGLARQHRWTIGAAHVNYGLRGAESEGDHAFARGLARRWGVRFHSRRMAHMEKGTGFNLQSWARRARYEFFDRLADRHGYDWIATAHQLNDSYSALSRLTRSSLPHGFVQWLHPISAQSYPGHHPAAVEPDQSGRGRGPGANG